MSTSKASKGKKAAARDNAPPPKPFKASNGTVVVVAEVREFDPFRVRPFPNQPRKRFRKIRELADSMLEIGQTSAGKVKVVKNDPKFDAELVDGERRLRGCMRANMKFRAEVVLESMDWNEQFAKSVAANFGKQDHDCLEIAQACAQLQKDGRRIHEIANLFCKSMTWVVQHISLLKLHPSVQEMLIPPDEEEDDPSVDPYQKKFADPKGRRKESAQLTFSLAITMTTMPHDLQIKISKEIVDAAMSMVQARRHILAMARQHGHTPKRKGRGRERFDGLVAFIARTRDSLGIYLDMSDPEFSRLMDNRKAGSRDEFFQGVGQLEKDLDKLTIIVKKKIALQGG